jgi:hypothetical protein
MNPELSLIVIWIQNWVLKVEILNSRAAFDKEIQMYKPQDVSTYLENKVLVFLQIWLVWNVAYFWHERFVNRNYVGFPLPKMKLRFLDCFYDSSLQHVCYDKHTPRVIVRFLNIGTVLLVIGCSNVTEILP